MYQLQDADPRQIGSYTLQGRLGSGGLGHVYLGRSLAGRAVAVKVIHPQLAADPGFRFRFARAADAARRVSGAFTAPVIDFDADAPLPWLATSYVAAPSLAATIRAHGPMPVPGVLSLAAGLAEALSAAHAVNVTHGNFTPGNVLLAVDGPRVTDFGMARAVDPARSPGDGLPPGFMSPERAGGLDQGPASDMFSLGAVLLYAATGEWMSHFAAHPEQLAPELRPFIERCLAADPAWRPTATEFLAELNALRAAPPPATAARPMPAAALGRTAAALGRTAVGWVRRKVSRRHVGLITIVALACAVVAAGVLYVIHPWPYPVLRPSGLAAANRGMNSITLDWSSPGSGPLPDRYVILRNNAVAATVPGDVNHFADRGLTPATTYDFRVIAYRGHKRSEASHDFYVATRTPPLSDAVFNSYFYVREKIIAGGSSVEGDSDGDTYSDNWTFSSNCAVGPCATLLSGAIDSEDFTVRLHPEGGGLLTGNVQIKDAYYCGTDTNNTEGSTLYISISAASAHPDADQWQADTFSGTLDWDIDADPNGNCGAGQVDFTVSS